MMRTRAVILGVLVALGAPAFAHTLDEYLQASLVSLETDSVHVSMRLTPGVAVFPQVFGGIDADSDRVLSTSEQKKYAERVLSEVSVSVDGHRLQPRLLSIQFAPLDEMKDGLGPIQIEFAAALPAGSSRRKLVFENHHQRVMSAYLVNCLVPQDSHIQVVAQHRAEDQSRYELDFTAR